jgi:nitrogen fixation-related uncharacterized protein
MFFFPDEKEEAAEMKNLEICLFGSLGSAFLWNMEPLQFDVEIQKSSRSFMDHRIVEFN